MYVNLINSYEEYEKHKKDIDNNDEKYIVKGFSRLGCYEALEFYKAVNDSGILSKVVISNMEMSEDYLVFIISHIKEIEKQNKQLQQERDKYKSIVDEIRDYIENGELLYLVSKCSIIYKDNIEVVAIYDRLKDLLDKLKELEEGNSNE